MTALDIHSASYATVFLARSGNKGNIHISQWPGVRFQTKKRGWCSDLYIFVYGGFPADLLIKGSKNVIKQVLEISRMLSNKSNLQKGYLTPEQCAHTMTPRPRSNFSNATRGRFCFEKLQIYVFVGETYFHAVWARSDPCFLLKPQTSKYWPNLKFYISWLQLFYQI